MEMNSDNILFLDSLKVGYGSGKNENVLLPSVRATAKKGELIAVIGRNGIGKSTLLRTITGLQPSQGGEIIYNGINIRKYSRMDLAHTIGYISTESVKVSNMSVYDLVSLGRFPHTNWIGRIDLKDHDIIMDALEKTSISAYCTKFIAELSDGERQKAMIARILAQDTPIMVMDEPTAFLDVGSKYEILQLMHQLSQESEKTIVFSTHDLDMAVSQSDKIWLISDKQVREGAPEDLMIEGAFDHLFDSSSVEYNPEHGTFSFISEEKGTIYIEGAGILRHWTEKAVNRAGFSVSAEKTIPYIILPSGSNRHWRLRTHDSLSEYNSIYELISWLKRGKIMPI